LTSETSQPASPPAQTPSAKKTERAKALARAWPARRKINRAAEARYTRLVNALKIALPAIAVLIVAAVLIYSGFNPNPSGIVLRTGDVEAVGDDLKMLNPRLTGVDGAQRPYTVTAKYAEQEKGRPDLIRLSEIEADVTIESNQWISITAKDGVLDGNSRLLTLEGGIDAYSDTGYEIHTPTAVVDFEKGIITGPQAVEAQGPLGTIKANGFEVLKDLKQVKFHGGVETHYVPEGRAPGAADDFEPIFEDDATVEGGATEQGAPQEAQPNESGGGAQ
jgi:lipopolysaccharide export system protein LptC